ncbi:MAG TPA: DUF3306 domain-containing protein [Burkholderiales bacterium]|nr:DUF3306 domain-containing protein [Burkholderiales bacterium]
MSSEGDFLNRWSRRKHAARRGAALPEPDPPPATEAPPASSPSMPAAEAPAPELPPVDSLKGLESEYKDFLRPDVDPATRSAALRKLFGDPHFNQMDGLDTYIDDYSKEDPIPPAMLRALNQARTLGLFEKEEREEEEEKRRAEGSTTEPTPAATPTETTALEPPAEPPSVEPTAPSPAEQTTKTSGA